MRVSVCAWVPALRRVTSCRTASGTRAFPPDAAQRAPLAALRCFDKQQFEILVPLARKIPGLRNFEVSRGPGREPPGSFVVVGRPRVISRNLQKM
jgi:hypothetical protein